MFPISGLRDFPALTFVALEDQAGVLSAEAEAVL
jgi:hypothetical protein